MAEIDFFKKELNRKIEDFRVHSKRHKSLYRNIRYTIFLLTGVSTVLAGIAIGSADIQQYLNVGVVIVTATIGGLSSFEGLRKPSELWIMERNLFHSLNDLKRSFEFDLAKDEKNLDVQKHFDFMQVLLNSAGEKWSKNVKLPASQ
jgi:hypothetical protein